MIKTLLILMISTFLFISPVTLETATLPDETYQKTIVYSEQDDVEFSFFQLYEDPRFDVNYGYSITTRHDVTIELTCNQEASITKDINVFLYKSVTSSIHPNEFVGVCAENEYGSIVVSDKDGDIINADFLYQTKLNSTVQYNTTMLTYSSSADIPDTDVPFLIAIAAILIITIFGILLYRRKYQVYLNQSLEEKPTTKPKLDVPSFIWVSIAIAIFVITITLVSIHYIYQNTYIYDVAVEEKTVEILDMNLDQLTLEETKYQSFVVHIDLDVISTQLYETELALPESAIDAHASNILNTYNNTIVGYNDWSLLFATESHKRYLISYTTEDDATIEFRFILDDNFNPTLYVYYFPPDNSAYWSQDGLIKYLNPEYYFQVPTDNPDFMALYTLLKDALNNNTS